MLASIRTVSRQNVFICRGKCQHSPEALGQTKPYCACGTCRNES